MDSTDFMNVTDEDLEIAINAGMERLAWSSKIQKSYNDATTFFGVGGNDKLTDGEREALITGYRGIPSIYGSDIGSTSQQEVGK